jgi:multidrug efflux pump subunit AcrB
VNGLLSNPRAYALIIALIIVAGLSALSSIPRDENPRIANRNAIVKVIFEGASAQRVEALVTEPLETRLREIPEVEHIDSRSSAGFSSLSISLFDEVTRGETDGIWSEVRDKLGESLPLLPAGAGKPQLEDRRTYPFNMVIAVSWQFDDVEPDILALGRYAKELESQLRGLPGTDFIGIQGEPQEEIVVDVDAAKAALLGLTPHDIGKAVLQADAKVTAGEIHNSRMRVAVEVEGALDTMERIRQIPLRQAEDGSAVTIGDIAQLQRQAMTPARDLAIINGKPAVVVGIRMLADQRSDLWSTDLRAELESIQQQFPANIKLDIIFDQERYTLHRLSDLAGNIAIGFVLIVLVLLFTLGWRSSLVVAVALPLTVLFAFACMNFTGLPFHQMSVAGLIVALGIMVDNAIVMVDTVNRNKQQGMTGLLATRKAVQHLWMPLLGSTATTILTFLPIVIMPGKAGEFVGGISLTVIFSLVGSYLISHLVIAGLAGRFLVRDQKLGWWHQGLQLSALGKRFAQSIDWSLQHPWRVLLLVMVLPLLGFFVGLRLPVIFFPPSDRDMINLEVYLPASASLQQTQKLTERLTIAIGKNEGIESLHWFIGRGAPMFYYNLVQNKENSQYYAQAMLTTAHFTVANRLVGQLQTQLDDEFPEAQILLRRLGQGPPVNASVELRLSGPNLDVLRAEGEALRAQIMAMPGVVHVRNSLSEAVPKLWLSVNENRARAAQLSLRDVANQLHEGVDGAIAGSILEGNESLPVRVRARDQKQIDLSGVNSWLLVPHTADNLGLPIPFSAIGELAIRPEIGVIPRRDGTRVNTVQVYIRDKVLPATVLNQVKELLAQRELPLPAGYHLEIAGDEEARNRAVDRLMGSLGLIAVLLVVAVVTAFNSFRLSGIIYMVAGQAAGLGMLALWLSGSPFGFTSIVGLMGLIGLAINAAIVILAELKTSKQAVTGERQAVVVAVVNTSRHIFSTTITTVMGFLPLILSGEAFWTPFAYVIAGGTVMTTLLSFYFVPAVFMLMARYRPFEAVTARAAS